MCTVWHVDKYKITFKLVIKKQDNLSRPGIIDARARYRAAARRLRNTDLEVGLMCVQNNHFNGEWRTSVLRSYGSSSPVCLYKL